MFLICYITIPSLNKVLYLVSLYLVINIIIIIIKYQIYIVLISNKCSEALNSATQNIIYQQSILMTSVIAMKP